MLSVGISVYNHEAFIADAISSALNLTDDVWVYDDASTDDSASVASGFPVHLIRGAENSGGPEGPRQALLENMNREWLFFLDSDDLLVRCPRFEDYQDADYIIPDIYLMSEPWEFGEMWRYEGWPLDAESCFALGREQEGAPMCCRGFVRGDFARKHGHARYASTRWAEDDATVIRWLSLGMRAAYYPQGCVGYRMHAQQRTETLNRERGLALADRIAFLDGDTSRIVPVS